VARCEPGTVAVICEKLSLLIDDCRLDVIRTAVPRPVPASLCAWAPRPSAVLSRGWPPCPFAGAKAAPPSGEGRGRQTGTLLSPVLKAKYRTFLSEPYGSVR